VARSPAPAAGWRAHFGVWASVAGVAFIALALALPRQPSAALAGAGEALAPAASAAWLVLAPMVAGFPLGDAELHLRLLSCAAAAAIIALLLWRATGAEQARPDQVASDTRSDAGSVAGPDPRAAAMVATGFGVLTVALSRSFFCAATSGGPVAVGALAALGLLALVERTLRAPTDARSGGGLAALAGAAAAGPMTAAALGWPLAALAVWRALRRRARWPAPAGFLFGIAAAVTLAVLARAAGWARWGEMARHLFLVPVFQGIARLSPEALASAASDLLDQIGVVGVLVAAMGLTRLRPGALFFALWPLAGGLVLSAAEGRAPGGSVGIVVALSALALPIGVGTARLAERLGRAALPASAAIGVMVATWPLLAR
jgi:hypothetical protein